MKKLKLFVENFLVYGLGGIINKIIPLIMVPIVTHLMPSTEYFGISDLSNTLVNLASAFAIMGMYDAMYRLFFEKEETEYKKDVCSTVLLFTTIISIIVFLVMLILRNIVSQVFFKTTEYSYIVIISAFTTLVTSTNSIVALPTRMENKRKVFLITNALSSILSYSISIPLILAKHYIIALPLATLISGLMIEISFMVLNRKWFQFKRFDKELLSQLLKIAVPLVPNFLIYWVFNSCDRLMITNMIGLGAEGVYTVGAKLGHVSQLIYSAFAGGWQYFAFTVMKENDQVETNSKVFEYLGVISYVASAGICCISYTFFKLIFKIDYLEGYIVAPYLFLAPLIQMLFQVEANQFLVIKKTWPNMFILSAGAIVNLIINYFLIPVLGIEGAAIATLMGYVVSVLVCTIILCKLKLMTVSKKFIFASVLMTVYLLVWRFLTKTNLILGIVAFICFSIALAVSYKKEIITVCNTLKTALIRKKTA